MGARLTSIKLEYARGETIAGRYEVADLLDESPLGLTYRVKHLESGKFVRLLLLRPKVANRERKQEVIDAYKLGRKLDHPNLVKLGELGEHEGIAFVAYEDFDGPTLRELVNQHRVEGKRFSVKEAGQITVQILEGLSALHAEGVVLRAVRPEYVLVQVRYTGPRQQNVVVKVKLVGAALWSLVPVGALAEDEFSRGEAQYLAPELKSFEPTPTPRCDVYSAGVMFYEMLTGTAPVGTFQLPSTIRQDLPKLVDDIVELVLANAPEDRYQSAADFRAEIQRIFEGSADEEGEAAPRSQPAIFIGIGILVVIAFAVGLAFLKGDPIAAQQAEMSHVRNDVAARHEKPSPDAIQAILSKHPANMVYVPAGPYVRGRMHFDPESSPGEPLAEVVDVPAFVIDAFEYPNAGGQMPLSKVTYAQAEQACASQGKRLCTADEWEKACKGPLNFIYGYGDTYDVEFCGDGLDRGGQPAGSKPECKSGWGVYDVAGNLREWTSTSPAGKDNRAVVKGGLRLNPAKGTRCAFSTDENKGFNDASMSLRCCRDGDAPPVAAPAPPAPSPGG